MYKEYKHDNRSKKLDEVRFMYKITDPKILHWLTESDYEEIGTRVEHILAGFLRNRADKNAVGFALKCKDWNWTY